MKTVRIFAVLCCMACLSSIAQATQHYYRITSAQTTGYTNSDDTPTMFSGKTTPRMTNTNEIWVIDTGKMSIFASIKFAPFTRKHYRDMNNKAKITLPNTEWKITPNGGFEIDETWSSDIPVSIEIQDDDGKTEEGDQLLLEQLKRHGNIANGNLLLTSQDRGETVSMTLTATIPNMAGGSATQTMRIAGTKITPEEVSAAALEPDMPELVQEEASAENLAQQQETAGAEAFPHEESQTPQPE